MEITNIMRVRTEGKRREIVETAAELFVEQGFERTSMSAIAERVGGSKATLYGYFSSKDDLLRAVLEYDVAQESMRVMRDFNPEDDLEEALLGLGIRYLTERLGPLPIANISILANQPRGSTLGFEFYEAMLRPAWQLLADHFQTMMEAGRLRRDDPWVAAMHWKGLNEGELVEKRLIGAMPVIDHAEIDNAAKLAVGAFLKIYAADD